MKLWKGKNQKEKNEEKEKRMKVPKTSNFFDLTVAGVGNSLGVGIFVLIGELTRNVAGPAVVVSVAVAAVAAVLCGLCFAEFGVRFLKSDSVYEYSYACSRESVAFILGWTLILEYVAGAASITRGIIVFIDNLVELKISNFLQDVAPINSSYVSPHFDFISFGLIIILTIALACGLKDPVFFKKLMTACTFILIVIIIIAGSFKADEKNWQLERPTEKGIRNGFFPFGFVGVVKGAAIALYGFIGFDTIGVSGNEIKQRKKNLPLAILSTIFITFAAYIGVGIILTLISPYYTHITNAALPFAFEQLNWETIKQLIIVGSFFAFLTSLFGTCFPISRTIYTMANDGLLFYFLGNNHPKTQTPVPAIAVGGLLTAVAAGFFTFQQLVNLTVLAALFAFTMVTIKVILSRYSPEYEKEKKISENDSYSENNKVTLKEMMKNCLNYNTKVPNLVTESIVMGNIFIFCISSTLLSVIIVIFSESLFSCSLESVLPASILLCIMLFNLISLTCQPKSQKEHFEKRVLKAPFATLLNCVGIFLNIFLMVSFEGSSWAHFSIWMGLGVVPHLLWFFLRRYRREMGENSLYKINKMNAIKLNESVWKIESEKKTFYEGAINPVFSEEMEYKVDEEGKIVEKVRNNANKASLQLKQAEIIQTVDLVMERSESLKSDIELELVSVNDSEQDAAIRPKTPQQLTTEDEIHWECVAEIHSEKEFSEESVALEIVDHTYNFLGEIDETNEESSPENSKGPNTPIPKNKPLPPLPEKAPQPKISNMDLTQQILQEIQQRMNKKRELLDNSNSKPNDSEKDVTEENKKENKEKNLIEGTANESDIKETMNNDKNVEESEKGKGKSEEQNKIKDFKEKLNQLLKNQGTLNSFPGRLYIPKSNNRKEDSKDEDEKNEDVVYKSIKTLNKSDIKGKLELLLSKGPPKRPFLGDSFNIKIKDTEETKDYEYEIQNVIPNGENPEVDSTKMKDGVELDSQRKNINSQINGLKSDSEIPSYA